MGFFNKTRDKWQVGKGHAKEESGKAINDPVLEGEGKGDKVSGNLKQAAEKIKDAFRK